MVKVKRKAPKKQKKSGGIFSSAKIIKSAERQQRNEVRSSEARDLATSTNEGTDIYEAREEDENIKELRKFDDVDVYEYELPEDFEDEEIDEDSRGANELIAPKTSKSKQKAQKKRSKAEDMEDEDEDGDDFQDLSDLIKDVPPLPSTTALKSGTKRKADREESDEDQELDEEYGINFDEMDEETENHSKLIQMTKDLAGPKKRKYRKEVNELHPESDYNVRPKGAAAKLTLGDLVGTLPSELDNLREDVVRLERTNIVTAPLPANIEARLERNAAYMKTAEDITKWETFVQEVRGKDAVSFPLKGQEVPVQSTTRTMVADLKAENDLELAIEAVLKESGMDNETIKKQQEEEFQMAKITEEEVRKQREEIIKMRNAMTYQSQKAVRQKKIKSKEFHRHLKKRNEKKKMSLEELKDLDPDAAREELEKAERLRVEERMTQRHNKKKSKFMKNSAVFDAGSRRQIEENIQLRDSLRKKMSGIEKEGSDQEFSDEEPLQPLPEYEAPTKGVFAMNFMKRHLEQPVEIEDDPDRELSHAEMIRLGRPKKAVEAGETPAEISASAFKLQSAAGQLDKVGSSAGSKMRTSGPVSVNFSQVAQPEQVEEVFDVVEFPEVAAPAILNQTAVGRKGSKAKATKSTPAQKSKQTNGKSSKSPAPETQAGAAPEKISLDADGWTPKSQTNGHGRGNKEDEENIHLDEDLNPIVNVGGVRDSENPYLNIEKTKKASRSGLTAKQARAKRSADEDVKIDLEGAVTISKDSTTANSKGRQKFNLLASSSKEQKQLVERAFGPDVEKEFEEEKQAMITEQNKPPKEEEDDGLPGWGTGWAGAGITQKKIDPKKLKSNKKRAESQAPVARKDGHLKNVIISEELSEQNLQYQLGELPRKYENVWEYEKATSSALGPQWNTTNSFKKLTEAKVSVKRGIAIEPVNEATALLQIGGVTNRRSLWKRNANEDDLKKLSHLGDSLDEDAF